MGSGGSAIIAVSKNEPASALSALSAVRRLAPLGNPRAGPSSFAAVVIGRTARNVDVAAALEYVAGRCRLTM